MTLKPSYPSKKPPVLNTGLIVSVTGQVGGAILGIIIVSLLVGLGLDELLQTSKHQFTVVLFLVSAPISLFMTYWLATRATKTLNSQEPVSRQSRPVEEEDNHE